MCIFTYFFVVSGKLEILTADPNGDPDADRTFLVGSKLELTCRFPTSKNESSQMFFTSFNANISSVTEKREYTGGYSILTISKPKVTTENEGSYTCKFLSNEKTVAIKIYKGKVLVHYFYVPIHINSDTANGK